MHTQLRIILPLVLLLIMGWTPTASADWVHYTTGCVYERWDWDGCLAKGQAWADEQDGPAYIKMLSTKESCGQYTYCGRWYGYRWGGEAGAEPTDCENASVYCNSKTPSSCSGELWFHEGTNHTECGTCSSGYVDAGEGFEGGHRCQLIEEQEECAEKGEMYQGLETGGYCTPVCKSGSALGNICLDVPEESCSPDSEDYIGSIGFGSNQKPVCGDNKCPKGGTYGFEEQADGSYQSTCFPKDSNPPQCPAGAALIVSGDQYSFQCSQINFDGKDDDDPDGSNGDSDGDGQGDLTGIAGQLEDIKNLMEKGNTNTNNINETLKKIGKNITDGTAALTEAIGNIPRGGGGGGSGGGTGTGDGEGDNNETVTWTGEAIDTELTDPAEEYDQVMADYQGKLNEIKNEIRSLFSTSLSSGGSVDDNIQTIHGVQVNFSVNRFLDGLNILGAIVLFCAAFISAGILFNGRG